MHTEKINSCIRNATNNINKVINALEDVIEIDGSSDLATGDIKTELQNIKTTLDSLKKAINSSSAIITEKRERLGI